MLYREKTIAALFLFFLAYMTPIVDSGVVCAEVGAPQGIVIVSEKDAGKMAVYMLSLIREREKNGFDVSEAKKLDKLSQEAAAGGDYEMSLQLINQAIALLEGMKTVVDRPPSEKLSDASATISVTLPVGVNELFQTKGVPEYTSGKDIVGEPLWNTTKLQSNNGKITIELDSMPVFLEETHEVQTISDYEKSPFGIQDLSSYDSRLADMGIHWVRLSGAGGPVWDAEEPQKGVFSWHRLDSIINSFSGHNMHILGTILCASRWDRGEDLWATKKGGPLDGVRIATKKLPKNLDAYKNYLKTVVKRYPQIKYWQIENEPDGPGWTDTPQNFAKLLKESFLSVKEANPKAKIVLAGVAMPKGFNSFYIPMLQALNAIKDAHTARYFDIFDLHWSAQFGGNYREHTPNGRILDAYVNEIRLNLAKFGYDDTPIWITEMSNYDGKPLPLEYTYSYHSEMQQAKELIKTIVYSLGHGIKKVFWVRIVEWHNFGGVGINNYFDTTGLVNNPKTDGKSYNKLSYYAYKLLVKKLTGCNLDNIESLDLGTGVYAYRFLRGGKGVYVLWYDPS